jgi:hypothetical protein
MATRWIAVILCYLGGWMAGEVAVGVLDLPSGIAIVPGILVGNVALAIALGWTLQIGRRSKPRLRSADAVATDLDRKADGATDAMRRRSVR